MPAQVDLRSRGTRWTSARWRNGPALGRAAGFSLDYIAMIVTPGGRPRIDRQMLAAKAEDLDKTIRQLSAMRDACLLLGLTRPRCGLAHT